MVIHQVTTQVGRLLRTKMSKYFICDIDTEINEGRSIDTAVALRRVQAHIIKHIDPEFSIKEFVDWYDSDVDKPLVINKNRYYWDHSK